MRAKLGGNDPPTAAATNYQLAHSPEPKLMCESRNGCGEWAT